MGKKKLLKEILEELSVLNTNMSSLIENQNRMLIKQLKMNDTDSQTAPPPSEEQPGD